MTTRQARGFAPPEDIEGLYLAKIASSGIAAADAARLGFSVMTGDETRAAGLWPQGLPALRISYFCPRTGKALRAGPSWPPFWRARALRDPVPPPKDFAKYLNPPRSGVCAYFPRTEAVDWPAVMADDAQSVIVTEGELKAAKATLEGYPTIGLGGVYNFRSNAPYSDLLPELEAVAWARRVVYVAYDSDILNNRHVAAAAWRLARLLSDRGAMPHLVVVPQDGDRKTGLDDFLVKHGVAGFDALLRGARPIGAVEALWQMNERYAAIEEGGQEVADFAACAKIKDAQLVYRTTRSTTESRLLADGTISHETVNLARAWLAWPLRATVRRLVYEPALPARSVVESDDGASDFNTWRGFAVEPVKGDTSPFARLMDHLFTGAPAQVKRWFVAWLAYPLQNPGAKLLTACVLHGLVHGSGKTLVGHTMRYIYGAAYTKVGQRELRSDFNDWAAGRSFILGDDITGLDRLELHDNLKVMITQDTVRINPKGLAAYELSDHANWLFTSNRANAFYLDNNDRRYFVWEVPASAGKLPRPFYQSYLDWLDAGGASALLYHLRSLDLSWFDPGDAAPETASKVKMREEARSDIANWVEDLRRDPDALLVGPGGVAMPGDLHSNRALRAAYCLHANLRDDDPKLPSKMGAALAAAGVEQVHDRRIVKGRGFSTDRYYAVRNPDRWARATLAEIQDHLAAAAGTPPDTTGPAKPAKNKKY